MATEKLVRPKDEAALVRAVVNGILDGRAEAHQALNLVPSDAFAGWLHKDIWEAVGSLIRSGSPPDIPSIERQLHNSGKLTNHDSWTRYESVLLDGHGWEDELNLANSVLSLYQRRELIKTYQKSIEEAGNLLSDHLAVAQNTMSTSLNIISGGIDEPERSGDSILGLVESKQRFVDNQDDPGKMLWFGVPSLDAESELGGLRAGAGNVILIAGRPGNFKTTWAIQALCSTAMKGEDILFVSLELNNMEVKEREAAWFTEVKRGNFHYGTYNEFAVGRLKANRDTMNRIHIWAPSKVTWSRLEAKIRGAALKGIKRIVIDHFGLISTDGIKMPAGAKIDSYKRYIAERMRELAKELQICILCLVQLNREIEKGKAPDMENLRETGALEEIAYSIIVLWAVESGVSAPSINGQQSDSNPTQFWFRVVKNRDGKSFRNKQVNPDGSTCHITECS